MVTIVGLEKRKAAELPGEIERMEVDEYDFLVPGTKKKIKLNHSYRYSAEPVSISEVVG